MLISTIVANKGAVVSTISAESTVGDLVAALSSLGIGALVVSQDGRTPIGIVSERDVVRAFSRDPDCLTHTVASIMTHTVHTTTADAHVTDVMALMTERRVRHVPVVDDEGHLVGIVSIGDLVKWRLDELESERSALLDYITQ